MEKTGVWTTEGFDGFRKGTLGNAGQNLYVSRAGVLQRIHQYDLNGNGYVDLVFCNDHNNSDKPPTYLYGDPFGDVTLAELPSDGSSSGAVADLNGDGYDDLVLGMHHNGKREDLNAFVYYGSPEGLSERRQQLLPAPSCISVTVGDFNGDGRPDLAFVCQDYHELPETYSHVERELDAEAPGVHVSAKSERYVRIFYQSALGFEPKRYVDLEIAAQQLGSADLDGDGYADLIVRSADGEVTVYWGGPQGLDPAQAARVPVPPGVGGASARPSFRERGLTARARGLQEIQDQPGEVFEDTQSLAQAVVLGGVPHVFVPQEQAALLVPMGGGRSFGQPIVLGCTSPLAIAVGDGGGNGSRTWWWRAGSPTKALSARGSTGRARTGTTILGGLRSGPRTRDVAVGDLDGDGRDEIVLCEMRTEASYTTESLVYRVEADGNVTGSVRLQTEDARRVLLARPAREDRPKIVFVNTQSRDALGDVKSTVYFGGPDGFSPERRKDIPGFRAVDAICCDVNDDGYVDIVIANSFANTVDRRPGSYVLLNGPGGLPDEPSMTFPTEHVQGVACADLNRDGYLDLVIAIIGDPDLLVFYGTADGFDTDNPQRVHLEHDGVVYAEPRFICLADLNNSGWLDLFVPDVAADRSILLWGGGRRVQHGALPDAVGLSRCLRPLGRLDRQRILGPDRRWAHDLFSRAARLLCLHLLEQSGRAARGPADSLAGQRHQLHGGGRFQQRWPPRHLHGLVQ